MPKIMLVEDDKSLREIYGVRLLAEGYDIVSAGDGEEALAMAIKERPSLIISDVMMPKISGFDMLDILRSTTETRDIKVIMMTALSSEDQRARGESLGADRYLIKSQVGIEDVVRVVHEVLQDTPGVVSTPTAPTPVNPPTPAGPPVNVPPLPRATAPMTPPARPMPTPTAPSTPIAPSAPTPSAVPPIAPVPAPHTAAPATTLPTNTPKPPSLRSRVIEPLNDPNVSPININDLLDKELAKEAGVTENGDPNPQTVDQERAIINQQLSQVPLSSPTPLASSDDIPSITVNEDGDVTPAPTPTPPEAPPTPQAAPAAIPTPVPSQQPPRPAQPTIPSPNPTLPRPPAPPFPPTPTPPPAA